MDLFSYDQIINLFPYDGNVYYYGKVCQVMKQIFILMNYITQLNGETMRE